jgi:hypothetical protein
MTTQKKRGEEPYQPEPLPQKNEQKQRNSDYWKYIRIMVL